MLYSSSLWFTESLLLNIFSDAKCFLLKATEIYLKMYPSHKTVWGDMWRPYCLVLGKRKHYIINSVFSLRIKTEYCYKSLSRHTKTLKSRNLEMLNDFATLQLCQRLQYCEGLVKVEIFICQKQTLLWYRLGYIHPSSKHLFFRKRLAADCTWTFSVEKSLVTIKVEKWVNTELQIVTRNIQNYFSYTEFSFTFIPTPQKNRQSSSTALWKSD